MAMQLSCKTSFAKGAAVRPAQRPRVQARRTVKVNAKYGEESKFFDLQDLENTTGSWDLYGQDDKKRYPDLQNKFFYQAGEAISRRGALRAFLTLGGVAGIVAYGLKGSRDVNLPIIKGPQTSGESGKGGSTRSRL